MRSDTAAKPAGHVGAAPSRVQQGRSGYIGGASQKGATAGLLWVAFRQDLAGHRLRPPGGGQAAPLCLEGRRKPAKRAELDGSSPQQKSPEVFDLMANPVLAFLSIFTSRLV
jgi:hypothetical protein